MKLNEETILRILSTLDKICNKLYDIEQNIDNLKLQNTNVDYIQEMNIVQLSNYLKCSEEYIRKLVARGELPNKKNKNKLVFDKSEIDKWIIDSAN